MSKAGDPVENALFMTLQVSESADTAAFHQRTHKLSNAE